MSKDPLVKIKDLKRASKYLGKDAAKQRGIPLSELKNYITPREVQSIIKQYAKRNDEGDYLINYGLLMKIYSEVDSWILGIELSKMASNDMLETYWDEDTNCMVFKFKEGTEQDGKKTI